MPQPEIERLVRALGGLSRAERRGQRLRRRRSRTGSPASAFSSHRSRGTGPLEILFVGLGDTARGQMAAALTAARSQKAASMRTRRAVHCLQHHRPQCGRRDGRARRRSRGGVCKAAQRRGAPRCRHRRDDGASVGNVEIPELTPPYRLARRDPTGADVEEARVVRDDIDRRVQALVSALLDSST